MWHRPLCRYRRSLYGCILKWRRLPLTTFRLHWFESFWPTRIVCLFYCSFFCVSSSVYRVLISVYYSKISFTASSVFLEQVVQVVQRVTTTWTKGGRVGVLFFLPLRHLGIRYSCMVFQDAPLIGTAKCLVCKGSKLGHTTSFHILSTYYSLIALYSLSY
jgi:hypothetical protein